MNNKFLKNLRYYSKHNRMSFELGKKALKRMSESQLLTFKLYVAQWVKDHRRKQLELTKEAQSLTK